MCANKSKAVGGYKDKNRVWTTDMSNSVEAEVQQKHDHEPRCCKMLYVIFFRGWRGVCSEAESEKNKGCIFEKQKCQHLAIITADCSLDYNLIRFQQIRSINQPHSVLCCSPASLPESKFHVFRVHISS